MQVTDRGGMGQDASEGEVRGIRLDGEGEFRLEVLEDWGRCEGLPLRQAPSASLD